MSKTTDTETAKKEELDRALIDSINNGDDVERVRQLLADGASILSKSHYGHTDLYNAAHYGRFESGRIHGNVKVAVCLAVRPIAKMTSNFNRLFKVFLLL